MEMRDLQWQWPEALVECGPAEDPSILLTGSARVGPVPVQIVALRVDPDVVGWPDYKPEVREEGYRADGLAKLLETLADEFDYLVSALEELIGEGRASVVPLRQGSYLMLVVSAAFASHAGLLHDSG
jgi:hypothetical protein